MKIFNDKEWIIKLISSYLKNAHKLAQQLCDSFAQDDLISGRCNKAMPRTGVTNTGLEFRFHGIGCWISDGNVSVDFDFMPDGRIGGFDAWRLHIFSKENPSIVGIRSLQEVQIALDSLLEQGSIQPVERSSLYKLSTIVDES